MPENDNKQSIYNKLYERDLTFEELADVRNNIVGFFMELIEADNENLQNNSI